MRIRWSLVGSVLTCTVLLTAYENETTSAHAVTGQVPDADFSDVTAAGTESNAARTLAPGHFSFTTGLDKEPQHIQGPVRCDTREDVYRIAIGEPDAGGVEIGLTEGESVLKYVDLGYRNGVNLALFNDGESDREIGKPVPVVHRTGSTYFVSGYATGLTAGNRDTGLYFEISVACP